MHVYQRERKRLKQVESLVQSRFPHFGINKKQELTRLLYEIAKRERKNPRTILREARYYHYQDLKKYLLRRRYPIASAAEQVLRPYLPRIQFKTTDPVPLRHARFYPRKIYIERKVAAGFLAGQFKMAFPRAAFFTIPPLKNYLDTHRRLTIEEYNKRRETVFIVSEDYDFFKTCPCTKQALGCGYRILNLGFGCIFECTYCYLQAYTNSPGIVLPDNIESFFEKLRASLKKGMRIGTGEFTDSLALDTITEYSLPIIEFFRKHPKAIFEFKTKSIEIKNILRAGAPHNIVVSWSINPQKIITENEYFTPALTHRLAAALQCVAAGLRVGFHFDPVIYFNGWEEDYHLAIESLFNTIPQRAIIWVSIGTFRFSPELKPVIERRFPGNKILDEELVLGFDGKLRYPSLVRYHMYQKIIEMLRRHSRAVPLYLCMEDVEMWKALKIKMPYFR